MCCHHEDGYPIHPTVWPEPASPAQVEVVRSAVAAGVLDGSFDESRVARSAAQHARTPAFWSTLSERRALFTEVLSVARASGGPDVLVAAAYAASRLNVRYMSGECRDGPWQLPVATVGVGPCQLQDDSWWTPGEGDVPSVDGHCTIRGCRPDPRRDLVASTKLALARVPPGASQGHAIEVLELGDPAVAAAVHLLAICALPDLFDASQRGHCDQVQVPDGIAR